MISFRQKGDFSKLTKFLERAKETVYLGDLNKYGRQGVAALASAKLPVHGTTKLKTIKNRLRLLFIIQTFKMGFLSPSSCNMVMELETEVGLKDEIISILQFSLFLTRL